MTPPHSAAPLDSNAENLFFFFSSEAWDSSECATAREPLKAREQGEVLVAVRGGGELGQSESV